jgi:hypothetical protein
MVEQRSPQKYPNRREGVDEIVGGYAGSDRDPETPQVTEETSTLGPPEALWIYRRPQRGCYAMDAAFSALVWCGGCGVLLKGKLRCDGEPCRKGKGEIAPSEVTLILEGIRIERIGNRDGQARKACASRCAAHLPAEGSRYQKGGAPPGYG